jgi:protein disulfide-isomerase A1
VRTESFPLIQQISPDNYQSYVDRKLPILWAFLDEDDREGKIELLRSAAVASKGKLSWVYLDAHEYDE